MKQTFLLLAVLTMLGISSPAQDSATGKKFHSMHEVNNATNYLNKSSDLQKAGWILMGTGGALVVTGLLVYWNNVDDSGIFGDLNAVPGAFTAILGGSAMITGVILLGRSSHYKQKAAGLSAFLRQEKFPTLQGSTVSMRPVPALCLRFSF
jgi:hypothetical protein